MHVEFFSTCTLFGATCTVLLVHVYFGVYVSVIVNDRRAVIKLISNPRISINAQAVGESINWNSRVAKQLNNRRGGH